MPSKTATGMAHLSISEPKDDDYDASWNFDDDMHDTAGDFHEEPEQAKPKQAEPVPAEPIPTEPEPEQIEPEHSKPEQPEPVSAEPESQLPEPQPESPPESELQSMPEPVPMQEPLQQHSSSEEPKSNGYVIAPAESIVDTPAKLEAMGQEREALRAEVEQLRKQLETIQETHSTEVTQLKTDLEESNTAKENAEEQYQTLLERVEKIKETLSARLNRDKAELEEAKERIEELETQNEELQNSAKSSGDDYGKLKEELADATRELATLRSRSNLSTENFNKEKEEMSKTVQRLKEEMATTTNAMGEWEVLAMEERSLKENLAEKVSDLEEQMEAFRQSYESASSERDSQTTLIDNLQNALREIQEARKKELRDMVETTESQLLAQKKLVQEAEARSNEAQEAAEELSKEVERTAPFEKEVKEKNLLIGKLRHEAIVLNDHLTKALRYLKKTKPEDNVDRQVVTNHLLHFLTLDRGDVKRFQVLQVMAGYLNWTDEQREQAGLARPGASGGSLKLPSSPFRRTPSASALNADLFTEPSSSKDKESLSDLWAGFLERSAQEGNPIDSTTPASRKASVSSEAPSPRPQASE